MWEVSSGVCLSSFNIGQLSASTVTAVSSDQVSVVNESAGANRTLVLLVIGFFSFSSHNRKVDH